MQGKNLGWKFLFVGLLIALSIYSMWANGFRQGIDLKGGYVMTFEVAVPANSSGDIIGQVIATLKQRIDPNGLYSLEWKPVGQDRFEVRMPMGTEAARKSREAYLKARDALLAGNVQRSDVYDLVQINEPDKRDKRFEQMAGDNAARKEALQAVLTAHADLQATKAKADQLAAQVEKLRAASQPAGALTAQLDRANKAVTDADFAYESALRAVFALNIDLDQVQKVLDMYVAGREQANLPPSEATSRMDSFKKGMADLEKKNPDRAAQIVALRDSFVNWTENRVGLDDPSDLTRMVAAAGVLEFRMAPTLPGSAELPMSDTDYNAYTDRLASRGPEGTPEDPYRWFPIRGNAERYHNLVTGEYLGKKYVLLFNRPDPDRTLLHTGAGASAWALTEARSTVDQNMKPAVGFSFDSRGANLFGILTGHNIGHFMAITLDDEVYSAPVIQSAIHDNGIITGEFTPQQVDDLVRTLNAGALTGKVNPNPVSEKVVAASLGQDNREAGIRAAIWGLIATGAFMAVYYFYAGMIANLAMMINLVLLLGAMSFIQAVFTLPGIAGTILSVTMAVDANVLIYERLREEQAKTQSMRMAIKNAYAGAFSAIFDSNLTTVIAALIMVWVGTEEVRGFGITLALGLSFSLFTALTVTRWIYTLMLDRNVLRNKVPMMRLIGVPNINWMSKRRVFWIGSLVLATAGLVTLFAQGKDIMGIEFSSGTQAIFSFNKGDMATLPDGKKAIPDRPVIEQALDQAAQQLAKADRDNAASDPAQAAALNQEADKLLKFKNSIRLETVINTRKAQLPRELGLSSDTITSQEWLKAGLAQEIFNQLDNNKDDTLDQVELAGLPENSYQVSTTVVDADLVQKVIFKAFGKSLAMHSKVESASFEDKGKVAGLGIALAGPYTEITREMAEKQVEASLQPVVVNYINGLLYVVDVKPGMSDAEMSSRIQTMRMQQDFAAYRNNRTQVLGLEGPAGNYTRLAVLVEKLPQQDINDLGRRTQGLISAALQRQESLESVQLFDPAMASESSQLAVVALVLSWLSIIAYLWLRFGSMQWGLAAVICLMHDVAIAIGMVAASAFLANTFLGKWLLITPIQIDMTIVAALLTIVGYSVNDTIVVFDRIRENRGKLKEITPVLINHAINQTLSRTILTSTATIFALAVMYIWGGPGIHGFCYTLLIGFVIGTFSSIAVASPLLLGFKEAFLGRAFPELSGRRPQPVKEPLATPPSQFQTPQGK